MPPALAALILLVVGYGLGYNLHRLALERLEAKRPSPKMPPKK